ncbi:MAG: hypothetical protein ACLUN5_00625 [Oscillospiraceae bacterium]
MNVRERMEQEEYEFLSPQAQKAAETKGRPEPEDDNDVRTCYQRDADRIVHSKSFRRLMHKTQVFLSPEGDHYRTRMTHTLEVARIARTICRAPAAQRRPGRGRRLRARSGAHALRSRGENALYRA